MFVSIRRYKVVPNAVGTLSQKVTEGFMPIISQSPGFMAYYLVDAGDDIVASVSVFQDQAGAEESNRMAADWVKVNIAALIVSAPEITAGAVTAYQIT